MTGNWPIYAIALCLLTSVPAFAGSADDLERLVKNGTESPAQIQPAAGGAQADTDTNVIRITPDETKVVRIDQDAASVIVANPAHASVVLDSPRLLVVMPRVPGTTSFTVLDAAGNTIAERTIIVSAAAKPKYMRIRRICGTDSSCQPSAYFYCPDGCYEVMPVQPEGAGGAAAPEITGNAAPAPADADLRPADSNTAPGSLTPGDIGAPVVSTPK